MADTGPYREEGPLVFLPGRAETAIEVVLACRPGLRPPIGMEIGPVPSAVSPAAVRHLVAKQCGPLEHFRVFDSAGRPFCERGGARIGWGMRCERAPCSSISLPPQPPAAAADTVKAVPYFATLATRFLRLCATGTLEMRGGNPSSTKFRISTRLRRQDSDERWAQRASDTQVRPASARVVKRTDSASVAGGRRGWVSAAVPQSAASPAFVALNRRHPCHPRHPCPAQVVAAATALLGPHAFSSKLCPSPQAEPAALASAGRRPAVTAVEVTVPGFARLLGVASSVAPSRERLHLGKRLATVALAAAFRHTELVFRVVAPTSSSHVRYSLQAVEPAGDPTAPED